ncbi:MAG: hypothetical protein ABR964_07505 [Tepidisphaeraceae bacterium]|jgi:hypothetical protein
MFHCLAATGSLRASPAVLITLTAILAASVWVFVTLVRHQTSLRRQTALSRWARTHGLRLADPARHDAAAILPPLAALSPRIELLLHGQAVAIAQVRADGSGAATAAKQNAAWHVLLCPLSGRWAPTGLRPAACTRSLIDLYSLSSFPSLASTKRFMIFGLAPPAAAALAQSSATALLPQDVGLLLHERYLLLDFTMRPFDEIEFSRMIDLAAQLVPRLASPQTVQ